MNTQQKIDNSQMESLQQTYQDAKKALTEHIISMLQKPAHKNWKSCNSHRLKYKAHKFLFWSYNLFDFDGSMANKSVKEYYVAFKKAHYTSYTNSRRPLKQAFTIMFEEIMASQQRITLNKDSKTPQITTLSQALKTQDTGLLFYDDGFQFTSNYIALKKAKKWYNWRFWTQDNPAMCAVSVALLAVFAIMTLS